MSKRPFAIAGLVVLSVLVVAGVGGLLYYQSLKRTPQYSLALLVDAAKHDDQQTINQLIDIDAVVDDFMPQILSKAVELYGRGMPPVIIDKMTALAEPLMPAIKDRARAQLALVIRDRTEQFGKVPFPAMVLGADRYLDFEVTGDTANVKSKLPGRPFEMKMRRNGERWQIVGVHDDQLATDIARSVGQQIIELATKGLTDQAAELLGVGKLADLLRQAQDLVR
ncbi:MAG: hypothetical protein ABJB40_05325 [Acidobacteriota bacterium]